jgi:hypothetical protein
MITEILWLISWPVLILVSWFAVSMAVNKFESKQ